MKKGLLVLFMILFVVDSFANDIAANVTNPVCDNDTLSKYNGTVNVEINWEPNVIDLRWYDGNTQLTPSNPASNSCTYDGDMYIPEPPTKTGYTFQGWTVRPQMDFGTLQLHKPDPELYSWAKTSKDCVYYYRNIDGDASQFTACDFSDNFQELQPHEWKAEFIEGDLYGMSGCSSTIGTYAEPGNPVIEHGTGLYCWCKVTGYKATGTDIISAPSNSLSWICVSTNGYGSAANCADDCAIRCTINAFWRTYFLSAMLTPANN